MEDDELKLNNYFSVGDMVLHYKTNICFEIIEIEGKIITILNLKTREFHRIKKHIKLYDELINRKIVNLTKESNEKRIKLWQDLKK